jgi:hypothetical protein
MGTPGDGGLIREDADDVGAALDLAVEALDGIGAVQLGTVLLRKGHVGQNVKLGVVHQGSKLLHLRPQLVGDTAPLVAGGFGVVLGEGGGPPHGAGAMVTPVAMKAETTRRPLLPALRRQQAPEGRRQP